MKAYVVRKPFDSSLEEVPMPVCAYDGVVVKVMAAAICHSDLDVIEGRRKHSVKFPNTLGHEFTGVVAEKGDGVKHVALGDHVVCECVIWCGVCDNCRSGITSRCLNFSELGTMEPGGFAEYTALPGRLTHPVTGLTFDEAAMMEPAGNGCHAAERANIEPGDRVAVVGPGPIGLLTMQVANTYNPSQMIVIGTRDGRLEFAKKLGATHTVNINKTDALKAVMDITEGKGANKVINCATTDAAFELCLKIMSIDGMILQEGMSGSAKPMPVIPDEFNTRNMSIIGVCGVHTRQFVKVITLAKDKRIDVASLVTHRFPLEKIEDAFELMRSKQDDVMKIMLYPN